jgi:hypothetical protein
VSVAMRGSSFFQSVDGDSPIRQGDIIVPYNIDESNEEKIQFGVIVTADCDIVQKKMGNFFTYVTMVTANYYLEEIWGFEEDTEIDQPNLYMISIKSAILKLSR